jgi:hypothetical protein
MLALVASIHVLNTTPNPPGEGVDGRDEPDHDGYGQCSWVTGSALRAAPE